MVSARATMLQGFAHPPGARLSSPGGWMVDRCPKISVLVMKAADDELNSYRTGESASPV